MHEVVLGSHAEEQPPASSATSPTNQLSPSENQKRLETLRQQTQTSLPATSTPEENERISRPILQHPFVDSAERTAQVEGTNLSNPPTGTPERTDSHTHRHVAFDPSALNADGSPVPLSQSRNRSNSFFRRMSQDKDRPEADAYYDSRAATKREWRRRATTLQDYYHENPELLPQLPFTWHHGRRRWRLGALISLMFIDACVLPIVLYYAMAYAGNVEGWIIFAVVTTIWGGPTYLEFGIRTLKLMKKERFYRPLGTESRWCFDLTNWASVVAITAVTALFVIGSAPHIVWLRVLCMPAPALLYSLGGVLSLITLYHARGWKAPFRISSTGKGQVVRPGVYYFVEDVMAVNVNAGRPYREAIAARYEASPRFREMLYKQSIFWGVPALILAVPLTVIAVIHSVPATIAYGICWAVPFIWATIWGLISMVWVKRDMVRERLEWEQAKGPVLKEREIAAANTATGLSTDGEESNKSTAAGADVV